MYSRVCLSSPSNSKGTPFRRELYCFLMKPVMRASTL
jgi:hypothetical protein